MGQDFGGWHRGNDQLGETTCPACFILVWGRPFQAKLFKYFRNNAKGLIIRGHNPLASLRWESSMWIADQSSDSEGAIDMVLSWSSSGIPKETSRDAGQKPDSAYATGKGWSGEWEE